MGEFMVSYKEHSAAAQYNQSKHLLGNVSHIVQSRYQLSWEAWEIASISAAFARSMSSINL